MSCKSAAPTGGGVPGIDVSFDHVGKPHFNTRLTLLKFGGTLAGSGATTGYDARINAPRLLLLGSAQGITTELEQGVYWVGQGKIKSAIGAQESFGQAAEAYKQSVSGNGLLGKIILKP